MRLTLLIFDYEIIVYQFRPPCPLCNRRMWPDRGVGDEEIFFCYFHGTWIPIPLERDGEPLPLCQWRTYSWRTV